MLTDMAVLHGGCIVCTRFSSRVNGHNRWRLLQVNALPVKTVFYAAVAPLLACYAIFALFLYPAAPHLHPHGFIEAFSPYVPIGFTGLLQCIENWTYSAFFCIAELWGAVVISVLFW